MDRLAREGARYAHCFTHAPVCAPSRSGLITGQYPTTIGTHHMRSQLLKPPPMFTEYLRKAGYTICWPTKAGFGKTDFNFEVPQDAFDVRTDWTQKKPQEPFFGFFNITWSHESKIRADADEFAKLTAKLKPGERHDPKKMAVPPYHPDAPEVRRDLANYYDLVTAVDKKMGEVLDTLEKWGIASNTVVILTGDRGRGLPRSKRWIYDSGIHVPLIARWPEHVKRGEEMPTMQAWRKWNAEGKLNAAQKLFFAPSKPKEELYDCIADPNEIRNLADDPTYSAKLKELRGALDKWIVETHDMGAIPEAE